MSKVTRISVPFMIVLLLFGCIRGSDPVMDPKEQSFYEMLELKETDDINTSMKMALSEYTQLPYKQGDNLYLDVNLTASATPLHTRNEKLAFFVYQAEKNLWDEVENLVTTFIPDDLAIYPIDNIDPIPLLFVGIPNPDQVDEGDVVIRAFFCVDVIEEGIETGEKIATFIDVEVTPDN